jgi:hypothetical protein
MEKSGGSPADVKGPAPGRWESLSLETSEAVGRRMGVIAERFCRALAAGRCPPTWALERKVFRRLLEAELPPGHSLAEINELLPESERNLRAARAHERIQSASHCVPLLPAELVEGRYLVWASPVLRPRGLPFRSLAGAVSVELAEIPRAVCELWSRPYLESLLSEVPHEARRVELAIGVTMLPEGELPASV